MTTATHRLTATFSGLAKPTQQDADDVLASLLGVFHERMPVEAASARAIRGFIDVQVDVALASEAEERDVVSRIQRATGLPPVDAVRLRRRKGRS